MGGIKNRHSIIQHQILIHTAAANIKTCCRFAGCADAGQSLKLSQQLKVVEVMLKLKLFVMVYHVH